MAHTIVLGGGFCGLAASMMLARDGHRVTVLERDGAPLPADTDAAWERWDREGVRQFRQAHYLQPRGLGVLDAELPEIRQALIDAGAVRYSALDALPPTITDREPRDGDDRFVTYNARRPTLERVLARAAEAQDGVEIRRGVAVGGLETRRSGGRVQVTAVRTSTGERIAGDLVVDAMGRGSKLPTLLADAGVDCVHEQADDSGFLYYTRFYRGELPAVRSALNTPIGSFSILTMPADNGTWSLTLYTASGDQPMKALRDPARFETLVGACPRHAHWLDGEPLTGVLAMGGIVDRIRRSGNGSGPPLGVVSLGDAWACTNPSLGRGMALGLVHAALLRTAARDSPDALTERFAADTDRELTPWYEATVAVDRARLAEIDAIRAGLAPPAPGSPVGAALPRAMGQDPDLFRAGLEIINCLKLPREVFARPGLAERVLAAAADVPVTPLGPDREQLLAILR